MKEKYGRTINGLLVAEVELIGPQDRITVHLAVDTGASRTVISSAIMEYVGLDPAVVGFRSHKVATPGGLTYTFLVRLDALRCLGRERLGIEVATKDIPPQMLVDGLLGLDFLGSGRLEFDFDAGTVALS